MPVPLLRIPAFMCLDASCPQRWAEMPSASINPSINQRLNQPHWLSVFNFKALGLSKQEGLRQSPRHRQALCILSGTFSMLTFFKSCIVTHVLMDKILETDSQRCAWFIWILLMESVEISIIASNRHAINASGKNQPKFRILEAPFLVPSTPEVLSTYVVWADALKQSCEWLLWQRKNHKDIGCFVQGQHEDPKWKPECYTFHLIMKDSSVSQSTRNPSCDKQHSIPYQTKERFCSESHI